jgi:hypothetical protein
VARSTEPQPAEALVMTLQRSAGNQAVAGVLQRKVALGTKPWLKANAKLPDVPDAVKAAYQDYVIEQAVTLARTWRDDNVATANRKFATPEALYTAACNAIVTAGGAPTRVGARWGALKAAVDKPGNITDLPWASFSAGEAAALESELAACKVQLSGNPDTTACHANAHGKLPKKVSGPNGENVADLPKKQQPAHTPYVEFLIPEKKNETGIERGILDRASGQIYVTAHYDVGSIVWLSGAPANLVANWTAKAQTYCTHLTNMT